MKIFALSLLLPLIPLSVSGKCPATGYVATGKIALENGKPAVGATVGISWIEANEPAGPAIGITDSQGKYKIRIPFHVYSGESVQGDICTGRLSKLSIMAYTKNMQSFSTVQQVQIGADGIIKLGTVPILFARAGQ
ncbi:hypothetical protein [Thermomonas fusca]